MGDVGSMIWKEWKEIVAQQGGTASGGVWLKITVALVLFGVLIPWKAGPEFITGLAAVIVPTLIPTMLILGTVTDSFAGERERHTLETLLASRLSDDAILLGKIIAAVLFAWIVLVAMLTLLVVGANAMHYRDHFLMFPISHLVPALVFNFLASLLLSTAGVLVSIRAATARQALQMLSVGLMVVIYGIGFGVRFFIPEEWRITLFRALTTDLARTEVIAALVLFGIATLLFTAARLRFRRTRLILD